MALDIGAGAGGAQMLQEVLTNLANTAYKNQSITLEKQRLQQQQEYQNSVLASQQEARDNAAKAQQAQKALKIAGVLKPKSEIDPATVAALNAGDLGGLVQHTDATLGSRNITGGVQSGPAPRIVGIASTANPGQAAKDIYQGTDAQLADDQARKDRADQIEQARQDRIAAQAQSKADKEDLIKLTASLRPPSQANTHARFNIVQGADANGKPAMIRTNVDTGEIEVLPVPAGANFVKRDQPATQDQSNAAIYSSRMEQAEPTLKQLEGGIASMNPLSYMAQSKVDNPALQSSEMQAYSQAARQFVNSVLRRESGAAISAGEFDSARKQYLPMPGDTPQTLQLKAAARSKAIADLQRTAGPAMPHGPAATGGGGGDAASKAAELLKKYGGG